MTTPRTVQEAFRFLADQATAAKASAPPQQVPALSGMASLYSELASWSTHPETQACAFAGRAHAGHVRWGVTVCQRMAAQGGDPDKLGLRAFVAAQLARIPVVSDERALPALWLWSQYARQAAALLRGLPVIVRGERGELGMMQGSLFVPTTPIDAQQVEATRGHLIHLREGLLQDLAIMLDHLNQPRRLHAVPRQTPPAEPAP